MKRFSKYGQMMRTVALWPLKMLVRAYQVGLSPLLPSSCRYAPTCSHYALEALEVHGPLRGTLLATRRILRCHPFERFGGGSGFDPVLAPLDKAKAAAGGSKCNHGPAHQFPLVRD